MAQVKLEINDLNATQFAARLRTFAGSLTGNANVPTLDPTPAALTTAAHSVGPRYAVQKHKEGEAVSATTATEMSRKARRALLRKEASTVQRATGGDATKILTAGFGVDMGREPAQLLPAPAALQSFTAIPPGRSTCKWPLEVRPSYTIKIADAAAGPGAFSNPVQQRAA